MDLRLVNYNYVAVIENTYLTYQCTLLSFLSEIYIYLLNTKVEFHIIIIIYTPLRVFHTSMEFEWQQVS